MFNLGKYGYTFILGVLGLFIIYVLAYDIIHNISSPILCMANDDIDKKLQAVSEVAKNVNASNNSLNVSNPEIHLHNPNIKIPSSLGTGIGLGSTVSAGISAMSKSKAIASMPLGTRAAMLAAGGIIGGTTFVAVNYVNTMAQKVANNSTNPSNSTSNNDSYPAKSIIGEGDSRDNIMYYLNLNIIICIILLLLIILLIYLYIYKSNSIKRIYGF